MGYLEKYSHVVYDGDRLTVYGTLSYNTFSERWEMRNPIAILLQGTNKEDIDSERRLLDEMSLQMNKADITGVIYYGIGCIMICGGLFIGLKLLVKYGPYFEWKVKRMASNIYFKIKEKLLALYHRFAPGPP
jgi:hypothetical protein